MVEPTKGKVDVLKEVRSHRSFASAKLTKSNQSLQCHEGMDRHGVCRTCRISLSQVQPTIELDSYFETSAVRLCEILLTWPPWEWRATSGPPILPVVPGQAGGGSFQKEKNYIAKKEFADRMLARRPTSAMPKSFLCLCSPAAVPWWWRDLFWCHEVACAARWSNVVGCQVRWWVLLLSCDVSCHVMSVQYYKCIPVLQSTSPELLSTTKYYSSILLCTTKYNSNTTRYYKVLLHDYARTTKYYSSTFLYYKVLLLIDPWRMKRHLQCAEQQESSSNVTKYCACHAKRISWLIRITFETSVTMRGARVIPWLLLLLLLVRLLRRTATIRTSATSTTNAGTHERSWLAQRDWLARKPLVGTKAAKKLVGTKPLAGTKAAGWHGSRWLTKQLHNWPKAAGRRKTPGTGWHKAAGWHKSRGLAGTKAPGWHKAAATKASGCTKPLAGTKPQWHKGIVLVLLLNS